MNIFKEFKWRGIIKDFSNNSEKHLTKSKVTAYIGFDPTAASLHVGSLLPIMCLARLQKFGHRPIVIVGGGTGMIGDPSGKSKERQLLTLEKIEENLHGIKKQLSVFLDFEANDNPAQIINNANWLRDLKLMDFLRDIGKHFTTNYMRSKESVKKREELGLSFTEFSYMLLQAYDFLDLFNNHNCTLQMGGSDQWGNILAGMDLIRKKTNQQAYGLTFPLVTSSSGIKFGKTESGTIWLDSELTSPYKFYQFWLNTGDKDVIKYIKFFTWLSEKEIEEIALDLKSNPDTRNAQNLLASEVTKLVHGNEGLKRAKRASNLLFGGSFRGISSQEIVEIFKDSPTSTITKNTLIKGVDISDLLSTTGLTKSKGESRRLIANGGIYFNGEKVHTPDLIVGLQNSIDSHFFILRKGKRNYHIIKITNNE